MNRTARSNLLARPIALAISAVIASPAMAIVAFPGADGAGANAVGGRNGDVYHVTSIADTNTPGTLRYGITHAPTLGRTVVFDVAGTIDLTSALTITHPNITIAGQTAPGQGITLRNYSFSANADDSIVRNLRSRLGISAAQESDSIDSDDGNNIMFDHMSASWSVDETFSLGHTANNVTIANSLIYQSLNNSIHSKGPHGYGSLDKSTIPAAYTLTHNLFADHNSRNPRPGTYNGDILNFEFDNNVIYNWGATAGYSGALGDKVDMNYRSNYLIAGPSTLSPTQAFKGGSTDSIIYQDNNLIDSNKNAALDGVNTGSAMFVGTYTPQATPFAFAPVNIESPLAAYNRIMARGGALPWARDTADLAIINQVKTHTGAIIDTVEEAGGYPVLTGTARAANFDSDGDGMPNWWELDRGSSPTVAYANPGNLTVYSPLENYLNYITNTSNFAGTSSNGDLDSSWLGGAPNGTDLLAGFTSDNTGTHSVTVSTPTYGMMNFDSAAAYTITGTNITLSDSTGTAAVNVINGSHTIASQLSLVGDAHFVVINSADVLDVTGNLNSSGHIVNKDGAGNAKFNYIRAATLNITGGTLGVHQIGTGFNNSAGTSRVSTLSITSNTHFDLTNNALIYDYTTGNGSTREAAIRNFLSATQLTSSTADAGRRLGYGDNSVLAKATYAGQSVADLLEILVGFTYAGDTDLGGVVDDSDFAKFAANFGNNTGNAVWRQGDFNYDGKVNLADFQLMLAGFAAEGTTLPTDVIAFGNANSIPVPEPIGISLVAVGAILASGCRRRN